MVSPELTDDIYPVLPLRDVVVFPHMIVPLFVGREKSVRALEEVMKGHKRILLVTQKNAADDNPNVTDIFTIGTLGMVLQLLKLPDGTVKVLVEGLTRYRVINYHQRDNFLEASTAPVAIPQSQSNELQALTRSAVSQFGNYLRFNKKISSDILGSLGRVKDASKLADTIAANLILSIEDKQSLLEAVSVKDRLERIYELMENEIAILKVEKRIRNRVKNQMDRTQREYYLNEQVKAIQKELGGEGEGSKDELDELEKKIKKTAFTKEAKERAVNELKKIRSMSPMSAEANVSRNYLDWLLALPWKNPSKLQLSLDKAEQILNEDHYGLHKIKERILEFIAVQIRTQQVKGPILCLVGPPGVGKTSLGESIARATDRPFVRVSLGGLRDESEIRGHRRTYIGSLPGKIIQGMRKAKHSNPLFLLDEIDKIGADWRGDPASALLEVLDPEQNKNFSDHYLEVDYDLSDVLFVTTANTLSMPQPLLDRMECLRIAGYTESEKLEIAKNHLIPKQRTNHGLKEEEWSVDEDSIRSLIRRYTREAGVRNLERECAKLARKTVRQILQKEQKAVHITDDNLKNYAGVMRYRYGSILEDDLIGVTTGLAWSENGGDLLSVEAVVTQGKGKANFTGTLGDVMKESVQAAISFIRSRASQLGIDPTLFEKHDIHLHVPEGATPKDGPSAGVAIYNSIVSALTNIPVDRHIAMTGEITLSGRVLPIGGLKEKMIAALRGGIKKIIIPYDNLKDIEEIPDNVKNALEIIPIKNAHEVLSLALKRAPFAQPWLNDQTSKAIMGEKQLKEKDDKTPITH